MMTGKSIFSALIPITIQNAGFRERNNDVDKIFKRRITAKYFLIVDDNYIDKKPYQSFQEMGG